MTVPADDTIMTTLGNANLGGGFFKPGFNYRFDGLQTRAHVYYPGLIMSVRRRPVVTIVQVYL